MTIERDPQIRFHEQGTLNSVARWIRSHDEGVAEWLKNARRAYDFAAKAFSRPDFIGWNCCGWVDMWAAWKADRQHSGLQDPFGRYHHPMPETLARFGSQIYDYGLGTRPPEESR